MELFFNSNLKKSDVALEGTLTSAGFSTLFLLGFLPLLLTLFLGLMTAAAMGQLRLIPLQVCRTENLKIQELSGETLKSLLKMNISVKALRAEKIAAQASLAASVAAQNPVGIAESLNWLEKVKALQAELKSAQVTMFAKLDLEVRLAQAKIINDSNREFRAFLQRVNFFLNASMTSNRTNLHSLAVRPDVKSDEPAIYEPLDDFSERQSSQAFWKLSLRIKNGTWLAQKIQGEARWNNYCGASLFLEDHEWKAKLWSMDKLGKYSWNHFSSSLPWQVSY